MSHSKQVASPCSVLEGGGLLAGRLCESNGSAASDEAGWDSSELVSGL